MVLRKQAPRPPLSERNEVQMASAVNPNDEEIKTENQEEQKMSIDLSNNTLMSLGSGSVNMADDGGIDKIKQDGVLNRQASVKFNKLQKQGSIRQIGQFRSELARSHNMNEEQKSYVEARRAQQPVAPGLPPNMDAETAARIEQRRQAEAQQDQVQANNNDISTDASEEEFNKNVKDRKNSIGWAIVIALVIGLQYWKYKEILEFWSQKLPMVQNWWFIDIAIYVVMGAYELFALKIQTRQNFAWFKKIDLIIFVMVSAFGIWGQVITNSQVYDDTLDLHTQNQIDTEDEAEKEKWQLYIDFAGLINFQVWIRVIMLYLVVAIVCCAGCFILSAQRSGENLHQERIQELAGRVPVMNSILKKKAHEYTKDDQAKNPDNNECVICYEEFKVGDGREIVELDCNNKHIFHLECIEKWVEKNDTCPTCRAKIGVDELKNDQ